MLLKEQVLNRIQIVRQTGKMIGLWVYFLLGGITSCFFDEELSAETVETS